MKKRTLATLLILGTGLFIGCGGNSSYTSNSNASNANKSNSNTNQNSSSNSNQQITKTDTAPVNISIEELGKKDLAELESYQGRLLTFKTELVKGWTDEKMTFSYVSLTVNCKGSFSEYKESVKLFQEGKTNDSIYADFKGVVEKVEDTGSTKTIHLKDCVLLKLDK